MIKIDLQRIVQWCSLVFAALAICVSFYFLFAEPKQIVVFDGTRFIPEELIVEKGNRVVFKNTSGEAFWPASSLHPYHTVFPSFDTKKPVEAGSSWSFVFNEPGTWAYHDHIHPEITGVIKVKTDTGVIPPQKCESPGEREMCQEKDMLKALHDGGIQSAFEFVATLFNQDENFKQGCHEVLHSLGREAYNLYANGDEMVFSDVTTYCGYGFFHGFIEGVIAWTGSLDEAQKFCEGFKELNRVSATEACYHGIGHGVMDGSDPRAWGNPMKMIEPALSVCSQVSVDEEQQLNCAVGVFNALVDFTVQGAFDLSIAPEDAYGFCAQVTPEKFKLGCYLQMNVITGYRPDRTLAQSFLLLPSVTEEEYVEPVIRTMAGSQAKAWHTQENYDSIIETCRTLEEELTISCLQGYTARLMDFGTIGNEYIRGVEFCNSAILLPEEKRSCVEFVGKVAGLDQKVEVREERCNYIRTQTGIGDLSCEPYQQN